MERPDPSPARGGRRMAWSDPVVRGALSVAWDYMRLVHARAPSDAILALGSFDPEVAVAAARLWHDGLAPVVVMSGGLAHRGGLLDTGWDRAEAHIFADIAAGRGVPRHAILIEDEAQNTGDNFAFSRRLLQERRIGIATLLVVAKPYMTRRGWATGRKVWPEAELRMQCEDLGVEAYLAREPDPERTVLALVGDLHRILVYPKLGFQMEQAVPPAVLDALRLLVDAGYGERLVPGHPLP